MKRTLKNKGLYGLLLFGFFCFMACEDDDSVIKLEQISVSDSDLQLGIGEIQSLTVAVLPEEATNSNVTWSSSNESVAQIQYNKKGLVAGVMGISNGEAILTAKLDSGGSEQSVSVSVITKVVSIILEEVISSDPSQTSYTVAFTPNDASIQDVIWASSEPDVATVVDGLITAIAPGVTVITATTVQGEKEASIEINVSGNPPILGLQYCSVTGTGSYNADTITSSGASQNINHIGDQPAGNFQHYDNEKVVAALGAGFSLSVTQSNNWSRTMVWADWNGDKDFEDAGELVLELGLGSQLNPGPFNGGISIPDDAVIGTTRLRVVTGDAWSYDPIPTSICGELENSTTKDFDLEIIGVAYCNVSGTGSYNADIITTTGGSTNINYSGGQPSNNYEFYTDEKLRINAGESFTLDVSQSNDWSRTMVWVDWNADGDFEDVGEFSQFLGLGSQSNISPLSAVIDVPADAASSALRMRVVTGDAWSYDPIPDSICGELENSSTKDFIIEIL